MATETPETKRSNSLLVIERLYVIESMIERLKTEFYLLE